MWIRDEIYVLIFNKQMDVFSRPREGESFKLGFAMSKRPHGGRPLFNALGVKKTKNQKKRNFIDQISFTQEDLQYFERHR